MELTIKTVIFSILGILAVYFFYSVRSILSPFIFGMIIAYLLDPVVDKLEIRGVSRRYGTLMIMILFFTIIIGAFVLLMPIFYNELTLFINRIPSYLNSFNARILPVLNKITNIFGMNETRSIEKYLNSYSKDILKFSGMFVNNIWSSSLNVISALSIIFIIPITTFYALKDWDKMIEKINGYLPGRYAVTIRRIVKDSDKVLASYLRGQLNVCLILGVFYSIGLMLTGLEFGFFIGFLTGIFTFIPYLGVFLGIFIGMIIAFFQYGLDFLHIGLVLIVFLSGQFLEGNFITPKIIGDKIGLHPMWIIFGLFAGGVLMGFVGVLIAVPVTAIAGVVIKSTLEYYKELFVNNKKINRDTKQKISAKNK